MQELHFSDYLLWSLRKCVLWCEWHWHSYQGKKGKLGGSEVLSEKDNAYFTCS